MTDILCAGSGKLIMQAIETEFAEFMVPTGGPAHKSWQGGSCSQCRGCI